MPIESATRSSTQLDESEALLADGFGEAFIGFGTQFNTEVAIYDYDQCVELLMRRDGMTFEDAAEHMEFNVTGAFVGQNTPVFLRTRPATIDGFRHP